jgi:gentisate 1,2-dioxygenase
MGRKEELAKRNLFDELMVLRDKQRKELSTALLTVKAEELPWEINPQGKMRWYLHPSLRDVATQTLMIYVQEIPPGSRSGRQLIQGGQMLFVWEGRGYTELSGQRHDWEANDLINLPPIPEGLVVQHFNGDSGNRVLLISAQPNYTGMVGVDMGCGFEQLEEAPEYREAQLELASADEQSRR